MFGFDLGRVRQLRTQRRHDLDALDRVDAQIRIQPHIKVQHLHRITGLFRYNAKQNLPNNRDLVRLSLGLDHRGAATLGAGRQKRHDLLERLQGSKMLRLDLWRPREATAQRRHDLDALDGVDSEVSIHSHLEIQHFTRIAGFLGHDFEYRSLIHGPVKRRSGWNHRICGRRVDRRNDTCGSVHIDRHRPDVRRTRCSTGGRGHRRISRYGSRGRLDRGASVQCQQ